MQTKTGTARLVSQETVTKTVEWTLTDIAEGWSLEAIKEGFEEDTLTHNYDADTITDSKGNIVAKLEEDYDDETSDDEQVYIEIDD